MSIALARELAVVDAGWAGAGLDGGVSGDLHLVTLLPYGALVAVIDGLGHGPEAALASREAVSILRSYAELSLEEPTRELSLQELIERCHEGLKGTRGAVLSAGLFDVRSATLSWCGVGNVEGVLVRADVTRERPSEALVTRGGVVGYRLPPLRVSTVSVCSADVLLLATDGIRSGFTRGIDIERKPQAIAEAVFSRDARGSDDALVLAVRYLGATR